MQKLVQDFAKQSHVYPHLKMENVLERSVKLVIKEMTVMKVRFLLFTRELAEIKYVILDLQNIMHIIVKNSYSEIFEVPSCYRYFNVRVKYPIMIISNRFLSVIACPAGMYGDNCAETCSGFCKTEPCIPTSQNGECPGKKCKAGYQGDDCNESEISAIY